MEEKKLNEGKPEGKIKGGLRELSESYNILRKVDKEKMMERKGQYNLPYLLICFILMGICFLVVIVSIMRLFT